MIMIIISLLFEYTVSMFISYTHISIQRFGIQIINLIVHKVPRLSL
jgi:hypothetical protein